MNSWKDLEVWKNSHQLVLKIYILITKLPDNEKYALCDQLKRSAYSIPSNIVEGHSKATTKDFLKYLYIARGSLEELRYFLILIKDLEYIKSETYYYFEDKTTIISKQLNSLIKSLKVQ
jgi:four helix bundle protein